MTTNTNTADRLALGRALFTATLQERIKALPPIERAALGSALESARRTAPTDATLVEIAALVATCEEGRLDA